ncbi:MAG TPA: hypothetical protein VLF87_02775 [Patescibacteria group bacterium]|nr:hypothetical protein [Patescibacteria group bacterium]
MAKAKTKKRQNTRPVQELDGIYVLKIVLYVLVGSQWLWLVDASNTKQVPLPIGLLLGTLFASHDHFKIDRKIEYALLIIAAMIGFWTHVGVYVNALR